MTPANSQPPATQPVWFITGCSSGFGRHLAEQTLKKGYNVVVTAPDINTLTDFKSHANALLLALDVTQQTQITAAVNAALKHFGHVDVLINNAGIGYLGAVEESSEAGIRQLFEVNFFGVSRMIHALLPSMRQRKKGFIVNFSSIAGLQGFPGIGYYSATKFALEGLSEALWQEIEPLGIKVMLVEPSGFRTQWFASAQDSSQHLPDYDATAGAFRTHLRQDTQPGDPFLAAQAIISALEAPHPPHRLLLGNNAVDWAKQKIHSEQQDFTTWENLARSTDYPQTEATL